MSSARNEMLKSMRSTAITRNRPTPAPTERISTLLGMLSTWFASTCRSGSETVIITPSRNATGMTSQS